VLEAERVHIARDFWRGEQWTPALDRIENQIRAMPAAISRVLDPQIETLQKIEKGQRVCCGQFPVHDPGEATAQVVQAVASREVAM
jgi:hypothetical protein